MWEGGSQIWGQTEPGHVRTLKSPVDTRSPLGIQEAEDLGSSMLPTMPYPIMGVIRPLRAWKGWPELQLCFLEPV